jgi:hypothetical protein
LVALSTSFLGPRSARPVGRVGGFGLERGTVRRVVAGGEHCADIDCSGQAVFDRDPPSRDKICRLDGEHQHGLAEQACVPAAGGIFVGFAQSLGGAAAIPVVRKAVTFSFCQTARSSSIRIATFVSNTMRSLGTQR